MTYLLVNELNSTHERRRVSHLEMSSVGSEVHMARMAMRYIWSDILKSDLLQDRNLIEVTLHAFQDQEPTGRSRSLTAEDIRRI